MTFPQDAIAAVTHLDPYPYYADLVARKPIYRDETQGLWIALSAAAVNAVLTSDRCRVRPLAEPVLRSVIEEVLRYDPPIQNTRRFLALDGRVADQKMKEGDVVLVVLAAANRDPLANPNPEQFDIFRKDRHIFTFGAGPHVCPGETLATMIASAGIEQWIVSGVDLEQLARTIIYRPSVNARIALLAIKEDA